MSRVIPFQPLLRDEECLIDILSKLRRGDMSTEQIRLREEFAALSEDPDLFPQLKEPLRSQALAELDWVREDIATLNYNSPAWA